MRKDAEANRARLIAAASDLMKAFGTDLPMEAIAAHAGLSRATVYRNFEDRFAMYEAVLADMLARLRERLDGEDAGPLDFILWLAEMMTGYDRFLASLSTLQGFDIEANHRRIVDAIARPLADAQRRGALSPTLTPDDIVIVCRMLAAHWRLDGVDRVDDALARRFRLLLPGLISPSHIHP